MNSPNTTARLAGALYLASAVAAGVPLIYVPGNLIVDGNPSATAVKILASETLFRVCIVSELAGAILLIFLALTLYRLFAETSRRQAAVMVILAIVSVPITFLNVLNEITALALFRGADFLAAIAVPQRDISGMLLLDAHSEGVAIANIFWGLWLFPLGLLVWKSGTVPRLLGALLIINCLALVTVSCTTLIVPAYADTAAEYAVIPELGELWFMAWLLIRGAGPRLRLAPA